MPQLYVMWMDIGLGAADFFPHTYDKTRASKITFLWNIKHCKFMLTLMPTVIKESRVLDQLYVTEYHIVSLQCSDQVN